MKGFSFLTFTFGFIIFSTETIYSEEKVQLISEEKCYTQTHKYKFTKSGETVSFYRTELKIGKQLEVLTSKYEPPKNRSDEEFRFSSKNINYLFKEKNKRLEGLVGVIQISRTNNKSSVYYYCFTDRASVASAHNINRNGILYSLEAFIEYPDVDGDGSPDIEYHYKVNQERKIINGRTTEGLFRGSCSVVPTKPLIETVKVGVQSIGWRLEAGRVCGNTYSPAYHYILVSPKATQYMNVEFTSKFPPVITQRRDNIEIWHVEQEWLDGGTWSSFYEPYLTTLKLNFDDDDVTRNGIYRDDYEGWPLYHLIKKDELGELESCVPNFQALYHAGRRYCNVSLMQKAFRLLYNSKNEETLKALGLPSTPQKIREEIATVRRRCVLKVSNKQRR